MFDNKGDAIRITVRALAFTASALLAGTAAAKPGVVLGDSIGVGVSMASKLPRLAHNSVTIRSTDVLDQIRNTPPGAVAFLSLGTNDAVGSISGVERGIDRIVDQASRANVKLVWLGPPCVLKRWNTTAERLDHILRARLADTDVSYVSLVDQQVCDRDLRAKDGVHFNMRGYALLWSRAQRATPGSIDAETRLASVEPTVKQHAVRHKAAHKRKVAVIAPDSQPVAGEESGPSPERDEQSR